MDSGDVERFVKAIDRLGLNYKDPGGPPGAVEFVGMELKEIKDILSSIDISLGRIADALENKNAAGRV